MFKPYLSWFWKTSEGVRLCLLLNVLAGVCHVGVSLFFVYVCKALVDIATRVSQASLPFYALLLAVAVVGQIALSACKNYLAARGDIALKNSLRRRLFAFLTGACGSGRYSRHTGDVLNRLEEDVRVVADVLGNRLPSLVSAALQFAAAFLFLLMLDARLAWAVAAIMPVCLLLSKIFMRRMRRLTHDIRQSDSRVQAHLQENVQNLILLKTLEQEQSAGRKLDRLQQTLYAQVMRRTNFSVYSRMWVSGAFAAGYVTAFLWGVHGIYEGTVSFGVMTAFLQLVGQVQQPLLEVSQQLPAVVQSTVSADRLMEIEGEEQEESSEERFLGSGAGICLDRVSFAYPGGDRKVVDGFSFDFAPGSRTAILGESGAGKSTLIRLMLALLRPQAGDLFVYKGDERVRVSRATRCNMVYVPQGNSLLSGTIRENLLLGNPEATEAELWEALRLAAAEFVEQLPAGLDTPCAEQGGGLSEGQAQRIAIARALLRRGSILLLDEFSASLDGETEERLLQNLTHGLPDRTMIFITHRLRITDYCDTVLKINKEKPLEITRLSGVRG